MDILTELKRIHDRCDKNDVVKFSADLDDDQWFFELTLKWMTSYDGKDGIPTHYADTEIIISGDNLETVMKKFDHQMSLHLKAEKEVEIEENKSSLITISNEVDWTQVKGCKQSGDGTLHNCYNNITINDNKDCLFGPPGSPQCRKKLNYVLLK